MINDFISFINKSPSSYHAIQSVEELLSHKKDKIVVFKKETSDGATLVAFDIGECVNDDSCFQIVSSHSDSPWFKVIGNSYEKEGLNLIKTERYGSQNLSSWYDRPLSLAGRVIYKNNDKKIVTTIILKDYTFIIPNLSVHFNKYIDDKTMINDGNPILGSKSHLLDIIATQLNISSDKIEEYNLNTYSKIEPLLWGDENEFLSSSRLDNLVSVFTSTTAFINSHDKNNINVLYIADNEEIGSQTEVGADSLFLDECIEKVVNSLKLNKSKLLLNSFMISADNAQAVSPHFDYIYNKDYKVYLNKGIVIKVSDRYSTTEETQLIIERMCKNNNLPYQVFHNRDDIPGGGTQGKIVQKHINIKSVDVGVSQLAMHSSYETIGAFDIKNAFDFFLSFYNKGVN